MEIRTRTARGEATRRALMDAALGLFAREGFHRTTVPDIVREAGVGHGTFYEYFSNRRDVLVALTKEAAVKSASRPAVDTPTLAERIRLEVLWYLSDYVENIELSKIWAEAVVDDPEINQDRRDLRAPLLRRIKRAIEMTAPAGIDAEIATHALFAMLELFAYRWFVQGDGPSRRPKDVVEAAATLANLWVNAIEAK